MASFADILNFFYFGTLLGVWETGNYSEISVGGGYSCGIKADNTLTCRDFEKYPPNILPNQKPIAAQFDGFNGEFYTPDGTCHFGKKLLPVDNSFKVYLDDNRAGYVYFYSGTSNDENGIISKQLWSVTDKSGKELSITEVRYGTSPSQSCIQVPLKQGSYSVKLVVQDNEGALSEPVIRQMKVLTLPVPIFLIDGKTSDVVVKSRTVQLDASTSKSENGIKDYIWTVRKWDSLTNKEGEILSDPKIDNVAKPSVTFKEYGDYRINLQVRDVDGEVSSSCSAITCSAIGMTLSVKLQNEPPKVVITADRTKGSAPLTVKVDASASTDSEGITEYIWSVTDDRGQNLPDIKLANEAKGSITFAQSGNYQIQVQVKDKFGAVASNQSGNGVSINVSNAIPTAIINVDKSEGPVPLTVTPNANASNDVDGKVTSYTWSVKEDASIKIDNAQQPKPIVFSKAGNYTIVLVVTDDKSSTSSAEKVITVKAKDNKLPVARITAISSTTGKAPLTVSLSGEKSGDDDGSIDKYEWSVSDGRPTVTGKYPPNIVFNKMGSYIVTLKVTDNGGASSTSDVQINVVDGCVSTYDSALGTVDIPCVTVENEPLAGFFKATLRQRVATALVAPFSFSLNASDRSDGELKRLSSLPESPCRAVYSLSKTELYIPCVQAGGDMYETYLGFKGNSDVFMFFELDTGPRLKKKVTP